MRLIYNIGIYFYYLLILLASAFNAKARLWIKGRKGVISRLKTGISEGDMIAWFHASSLGEFEQGKPVIESFRNKYPDYKILLTFFSPSGYEIRKNYENADLIFYLPADTLRNARRFINAVKPQMAFFIKYEYWYNYLHVLNRKNIAVYMISANYRHGQHFFKWYGSWFRKHLRHISHFFVQNEESRDLLNSIGAEQVTVSGDTRFDRVYAISQEKKSFPLIEEFIRDRKAFIGGSTWEKDEEMIYSLYASEIKTEGDKRRRMKYIIAPHLTDEAHLKGIISRFGGKAVRYSKLAKTEDLEGDVMIIDTIGMLSQIYRYAEISYIGGGFGNGIHNILEAAVYGKPVIFGPKYNKFNEAMELITLGGAFSIDNSKKLIETVSKLQQDKFFMSRTCSLTLNYVLDRRGATNRIISSIR
jgi:3-deoxy-D-manno-octulosonic-acid transferase